MDRKVNIKKVIKVFTILCLALIMQIGANIIADTERGYKATGSEVFVFPLVCFVGYKAFCETGENLLDGEEE